MKNIISYPHLDSFRKKIFISYFFGFLPLILVSIGTFYSPGFILFVLFLLIPSSINFLYFLHILQAVPVQMDNEAFYFEKDTIEYKVPFSQVQNIKAKHFPSRKWRVLLYSITIYYKNKQGQTKKIYFISTDQQNNYTLDSFFSFKDIPFVSELKEHIQLHSK